MRARIALSVAAITLASAYLVGGAAYWSWGQFHVDVAVLRDGRATHRMHALGAMVGWREKLARWTRPAVSLLSLERERPCSAELAATLEAAATAVRERAGDDVVQTARTMFDGNCPAFELFTAATVDGRTWHLERGADRTWTVRLSTDPNAQ